MKVADIYRDSRYEIRLKAPILNVVIITLFVAGLLIGVLGIIVIDRFVLGVSMFVLCVVFFVNLLVLRRGRYTFAAISTVYSIAIGLSLSLLASAYIGEHAFATAALELLFVILIALFFAPERKHLLTVIIIANVAVLSLIILVLLVYRNYSQHSASIVQQLFGAVVILPLFSVLSLNLKSVFDKVIADSQSRMKERDEKASAVKEIALEASDHFTVVHSMKETSDKASKAVFEIERNVGTIVKKVENLSTQYEISYQSLENIARGMKTLDEVATDQSANTTETGAALEEMVASIRNVSAVIQGKMESVDSLRRTAEGGAEIISKTADSFSQVLEHLGSVREMIGMISNISSQTNLLAMNAAIEAAHAGDAGRGFAVVADEVRKLAESSSRNAKQVSLTIKKLLSAIEDTDTNVSKSGESFRSISEEVSAVGKAMEEISVSIRELSVGSDEVLKATASMNELTARVVDAVLDAKGNEERAIENVAALGEFISSLAENLSEINEGNRHINEAARDLAEKSAALDQSVTDFTSRLHLE